MRAELQKRLIKLVDLFTCVASLGIRSVTDNMEVIKRAGYASTGDVEARVSLGV